MTDQERVAAGAIVGAFAGAMAAYVLFTNRGRTALHRVGPALRDLSHAIAEFRGVLVQVDDVVSADAQADEPNSGPRPVRSLPRPGPTPV